VCDAVLGVSELLEKNTKVSCAALDMQHLTEQISARLGLPADLVLSEPVEPGERPTRLVVSAIDPFHKLNGQRQNGVGSMPQRRWARRGEVVLRRRCTRRTSISCSPRRG
jgi:hypothetical protein